MIRKKTAAIMLIICLLIGSLPTVALATGNGDTEQSSMIQLMGVMGIMSGYPDGSFGGYDTLTRGQFAKILTAASTYKSLVSTSERTSPFKDVSSGHWAAPYVKVAAQKKLLYGYPDGTYRPDEYVKTEEVVTAVLRMLGYADTDFGTSWPNGQMATAQSIGLLDGITSAVSHPINRYDTMELIYHMLNTKVKDGGQYYAQKLGYTMNGTTVDLAAAITQNMTGPITVTDNWYVSLGLDPSSMTVYRDGERASYSAISQYDVTYYSRQSNTVWCYSQKVSGTLEQISPNQDTPSSIVVAGNTYALEGVTAYSKVATGGSFKLGDTVTVLLGKDKKAADVVGQTAASSQTNSIGYLSAAGQKSFTDTAGHAYTNYYAGVTKIDGTYLEFETDISYSAIVGSVVKADTSQGKTVITKMAASLDGGIFDYNNLKLGEYKLSKDIKLMDIAPYEYDRSGKYTLLYPQRIANIQIQSQMVAYYVRNSSNEICELYFNNLTNDMYKFGIISSVTSSTNSDGDITTYKYTIETAAGNYSYSTTNNINYSQYTPVLVDIEGSSVKGLTQLTPLSGTITAIWDTYIETPGKNYLLASDVLVYQDFNGKKVSVSLSQIGEDLSGYDIYAYLDKDVDNGGRVRAILINQKITE